MNYTIMHGTENYFVVIDDMDSKVEDPNSLAKELCAKEKTDGLILVLPSDKADFRMRIFNADGSEPEMCGNGIRCFAKFVYDKKLTEKKKIKVETLAGEIIPEILDDDMIKVDMGLPYLEAKNVPINVDRHTVFMAPFEIDGEKFDISCLSMGNPHCVIMVDEITDHMVLELGPKIETHEMFPKKINVEFIKILNKKEIEMRVWERGVGETKACGTGASAAFVVALINMKVDPKVTVHLLGGDLVLECNSDDMHIMMTGPAVTVKEVS